MIKISFVVTNCKRTGPINQTLNIIRYLDRELFEPSLITLFPEEKGNSMLKEYQKCNISIYTLNYSKSKSLLFGKKAVCNILSLINPDIIQGVGIPPYRMTLLYKSALHLVTLRNYCYEDYPDQYGKILGPILAYLDMRLIRKQIKKGEPFLTCSSSLSDMYKDRMHLNFKYIRNGVELGKYPKRKIDCMPKLRLQLDLPSDKIIFIYTGRMIDRKNQEEAIKAFLISKNSLKASLVLLGDGDNYNVLKKKYASESNVIFRGNVTNVSEYLCASDVYISSSKSEGLPNGVLEAMSVGIPVILSNIPQHMEVLSASDRFGMYYELGSVSQLSNMIDSIFNLDILEMGNISRIIVEKNYSAQIMSEKYQIFYRQLLNE